MSDLPSGLTPLELAAYVHAQIDAGHAYARRRKRGFRWRAVVLRVVLVGCSAASTIILGLQNLDPWTGTAFALVAVVTTFSALESFFAWRPLWVAMEEASYRFNRLRDELGFYVATTASDQLDPQRVRETFDAYQRIWEQLGTSWIGLREHSER
ncbi:SLATT domain-containing protein [Nocardia bovistercoris]|uniref:SLATT domain-containing protein n=1 Tax=Nocardia bovistercoris TaxID=2785916 RepID=A0A931N2K4_9NOCA|nr:SLATT domain-containing protein [Nocardia bovistercoris]